MIKLLTKLFVKDYNNVSDPKVRESYGTMTGSTGIVLNILLFAGKLLAGILSGAISVVADALNNLSDAGSSIITLLGFRLSGKPTDAEHPFGHGRIEYLAGLIVSIIIIVVGLELGKTSIEKIITPSTVTVSALTLVVLCASILVKLWMFVFNRVIAKKIDSAAMRATALDSISDVLATSVVLIGALVTYFTKISIDGYAGIIVALFICFTGFKAIKELAGLLMGTKADPAFVKAIADYVMDSPIVIGVHDLVVHNYGPGRQMISLHAEVPADMDFLEAHDAIDNIERGLKEKFNCPATIHMDPIIVNDEAAEKVKAEILKIALSIDKDITIHDFRMNKGSTHSNLIFDVVIPYDKKVDVTAVTRQLNEKVKEFNPTFNTVINIDRPFI